MKAAHLTRELQMKGGVFPTLDVRGMLIASSQAPEHNQIDCTAITPDVTASVRIVEIRVLVQIQTLL